MSTSFLRTPLDSGFDIHDTALDGPLILCAPILSRRLRNSLLVLPCTMGSYDRGGLWSGWVGRGQDSLAAIPISPPVAA